MSQSESFEALASHVREKLQEEPEFYIRTLTLEETFGLVDPWFQDFRRWVADHGQPFYFRMGWQRSDGHQSGHVDFAVSDFK
ncbi:hypothetical protein [Luteolibacter soli]|uniref:Uncharacterized protein n=1 Tax=Luteolibacter soli TaxID=3135280 RepID=A0ABU9B0L2_9BACT